MITQAECSEIRAGLLQQHEGILEAERRYMDYLVGVTLGAAETLFADFDRANDLLPFWIRYAPRQRGRAPTGKSIPWSEVGEKSLSYNLLRAISISDLAVSFPGLPFGGDIRFATGDALIHFDVKMTGPNDNANEVVVPPQQVSGDGAIWDEGGVVSNPFLVAGERKTINFQPKLSPFYILDGTVRLCLTYFLKVVYTVKEFGVQPLNYLEVICVPNGLLMFDGPFWARTPGLLIPGKDTQTTPEHVKRTRVRLDPLASLDAWRCQKIMKVDEQWKVTPRRAAA
jgi:hypothetical protein